jgi:hypothetical protein
MAFAAVLFEAQNTRRHFGVAGKKFFCDPRGLIARAVIDHDQFSRRPQILQINKKSGQIVGQAAGLVKSRDDDGERRRHP